MKNFQKIKKEQRVRRHRRIRAKISGEEKKPRLSVFRSDKHISLQLIDDTTGKTLLAVSDAALGKKAVGKRKRAVSAPPKDLGGRTTKVAIAYEVGKMIADKAKKKGIESVVFDRGGFIFHGRIKAAAEGARDGGLKF